NPVVLVPTMDRLATEVPTQCRHHIVVPVVEAPRADVELLPVDANDASNALRIAGLKDDRRADEVARLGRRSLTALRRRLAVKPELHTPAWAHSPVSRAIRGVLLAGRWSDQVEGDQRILTELTGLDADAFREQLEALALRQDPFVAALAGG